MLKTFLIGLKDVRLVFRDRTALIFMLAAPFVITLGIRRNGKLWYGRGIWESK